MPKGSANSKAASYWFCARHRSSMFGRFIAGQGRRPLLLSGPVGDSARREMAEILKYPEGLSAGRPQAFIQGYLHFLFQDRPENVLASEVVVRARRIADGLVTSVRAPNRGISHHGYQMVVAPGEYDISVVRDGTPVSATVRVGTSDRDVLWLKFYSDGSHCLHRAGATGCQ